MSNPFNEIQELLNQRADYNARLTSTYVDVYSEELHQLLLRNAREARELRKNIRRIERNRQTLRRHIP